MKLQTLSTIIAAACVLAPSIGLAQGVPSIDSVDPAHGTKLMSTEGFTYEVSSSAGALVNLTVEVAPQGGATALTLDLPANAAALAAYYTASGNPESAGIVALAVQNLSASQAVWSVEINTAHPEWQDMLDGNPLSNVTFTATAYDTTTANGATTTVHKLVNAGVADYDSDGKADKALRMGSGAIRWLRSSDTTPSPAGEVVEDAIAVAGDFDGDGRDDQTWFKAEGNQCEWHTIPSSQGGTPQIFYFGPGEGCLPIVGDFDGDGADDFGVQRPSDGKQLHWPSTSASRMRGADRPGAGDQVTSPFGDEESLPAVGDYDGDGYCDNAWFRSGAGVWRMQRSTRGWKRHVFGAGGSAIPVPGDYDGDGKTDLAVLLSDNRVTWMESSKVGSRRLMPPNGDPQLRPWRRLFADAAFVPADYNGDGITDPTWVRPRGDNHQWFHRISRRDGDTVRYARISPVWGPVTAVPVLADSRTVGEVNWTVLPEFAVPPAGVAKPVRLNFNESFVVEAEMNNCRASSGYERYFFCLDAFLVDIFTGPTEIYLRLANGAIDFMTASTGQVSAPGGGSDHIAICNGVRGGHRTGTHLLRLEYILGEGVNYGTANYGTCRMYWDGVKSGDFTFRVRSYPTAMTTWKVANMASCTLRYYQGDFVSLDDQ